VPVVAAYIWFASLGTWRDWPAGTHYYDRLATAFAQGHSWLDAQPDAALLALRDPYDPAQREDVPHLPDASLYQGRYYLYFGPVPGLLVMVLKFVYPMEVQDLQVTFVFVCAIFFLMELFVLHLWKRFFPDLSAWEVGATCVAIGLMSPFCWVLGNRGWVHNAAIAAGAFFFLAGLYAALDLVKDGEISVANGFAAGVMWALSIGSRMGQIVPVSLVVVLITVAIWRRYGSSVGSLQSLKGLVAIVAPVAAGLALLGAYNMVRFGSFTEFGQTYQLAFLNLRQSSADLFSIRYALQNAYNYLLMPPKIRLNFPYVWMQMGIRKPLLPTMGMPSLYFAEIITGMLYVSPFFLFALVPAVWPGIQRHEQIKQDLWGLLAPALAAAFLGSFGLFLDYFWASERFMLDFAAPLLLLAVFGAWSWQTHWSAFRVRRALVALLAGGVAAASVLMNILLAIGLNADAFRALDPVLWQQLNNVFR